MKLIKYTKDQKERMAKKLKAMKDGTVFDLNREDPLKVRIEKRALGKYPVLAIYDAETNSKLVSASGYGSDEAYVNLVELIIEMLNDWDIVNKQHFIDLSRKQGHDV